MAIHVVGSGGTSSISGGTAADTVTVSGGYVTSAQLGDGADKFTISSGSGKLVYMQNGNDTVTIKGGSVGTLSLGNGNDKVTMSGGKVTTMSLYGGTNTVSVSAGTITSMTGGSGANTITMTGGNVGLASGVMANVGLTSGTATVNVKGATVTKLASTATKGTVNVSSGTLSTMTGDLGSEIITVSGGLLTDARLGDGADKFTISAGSAKLVYLQNGDDVVAVKGGNVGTMSLGNGNDSVTMSAGTVTTMSLYGGTNTIAISGGTITSMTGGSGTNKINMNGGSIGWASGTASSITGGAGADAITVKGGYIANAQVGSGSDNFTISAGTAKLVYMQSGNDTVSVKGGSVGTLSMGSGTDKLTMSAGKISTVSLYAGTNTVTMSGGTVSKINGGTGKDTITVSGGSVSSITCGSGSDVVSIDWAKTKNVSINAGETGAMGADQLTLKNVNSTDFTFEYANTAKTQLRLKDANGKYILISNWAANPMTSITFADKTLTKAQIAEMLNGSSDVYGAHSTDGSALNGNYITKTATTISGSVYGARVDGKASQESLSEENVATVNDSTVGGGVYGIYISESGDAIRNRAYVNGGTVKGDVAGAWIASGNGSAVQNEAIIQSGTVGNAFGGYSKNGLVRDNYVQVSGTAVVTGDVYTAYTENGAAGYNVAIISDSAKVNGSVLGASGEDYIEIGTTNATKVEAKGGEDTIKVTAGSGHVINGGGGVDDFVIDWTKAKDITINNTTDDTAAYDFLQVQGAKSIDFTYAYSSTTDTLTLTNNSKYIKVEGWKNHPLGNIEFDDKELSFKEINKKVSLTSGGPVYVADNATYNAKAGQVFSFGDNLIEADVTINGLGNDNVIDLTGIHIDVACIEFQAKYNRFSYIPEDGYGNELGLVDIYMDCIGTNATTKIRFSDYDDETDEWTDFTLRLVTGTEATETVNLDDYYTNGEYVMYYTNGSKTGPEVITATKANSLIYGTMDQEKINLSGFGSHGVYTYGGDDEIVVNSTNREAWCDVVAGDGNDTIVISGIEDGFIGGDYDDDVIYVSNVYGHAEIMGDHGNDKYFIDISNVENADIHLRANDEISNEGQDQLIVCGSSLNKLMIGYADNHPSVMVIDEYDAVTDEWLGNISLEGWQANPLTSIKVLDSSTNKAYSIAFSKVKSALTSADASICMADLGMTASTLTSDSDYVLAESLKLKLAGSK